MNDFAERLKQRVNQAEGEHEEAVRRQSAENHEQKARQARITQLALTYRNDIALPIFRTAAEQMGAGQSLVTDDGECAHSCQFRLIHPKLGSGIIRFMATKLGERHVRLDVALDRSSASGYGQQDFEKRIELSIDSPPDDARSWIEEQVCECAAVWRKLTLANA